MASCISACFGPALFQPSYFKMGSHSKDKHRELEAESSSTRKHKSSRKDKDSKSKKEHKEKKSSKDKKSRVVDDDADDNEDEMWVEKGDASAEQVGLEELR